MRRTIVSLAVLVAALAATAAAVASGGGAITAHVLGAGSVAHPYAIHVADPADIVIARAKVPPGASFGWHSHRADVTAVVTSGTLTLYDSAVKHCSPRRFSAGHAFVEHRNHVHLARNEGTKPVTVLVEYIGLEHGTNPDAPATKPESCSVG